MLTLKLFWMGDRQSTILTSYNKITLCIWIRGRTTIVCKCRSTPLIWLCRLKTYKYTHTWTQRLNNDRLFNYHYRLFINGIQINPNFFLWKLFTIIYTDITSYIVIWSFRFKLSAYCFVFVNFFFSNHCSTEYFDFYNEISEKSILNWDSSIAILISISKNGSAGSERK